MNDFDNLRRRAERALHEMPAWSGNAAAADTRALLYELQVHEVELQMQNEALREAHLEADTARESYRKLFDEAPVAYLCLDGDGLIRDCNQAAAALLGKPVQALRGKRLSAFVAGEHTELFEHHRRQVAASDERCTCMLTLTDVKGRLREVRVESARSSAPLWRCAIVDLTELHKLQRRLQHMQKLEAMSTLASGVAHEFNNMLTGILGLTDMALDQLAPHAAGRTPIELLHQAALRGRSIVDQLLTFARRDGRPEAIDVNELVGGSELMLRSMLGAQITLELQLDAQHASVHGNAGELQQILLNLASNARHAMPEGGVFRVATCDGSRDELDALAHAELGFRRCVVLAASDNGTGMNAEARARAFEPFFTTKPAGTGTGLGLSMVYGAVRRAGGHIEIDSQLGRGTTLRLYWPALDNGVGAGAGMRRSASAHPEHVLVVDDDRLVRMAVRHYLQRTGCQVSEARSGEEALELLRDAGAVGVQMLVADVALPGIKGMQLAAAARARMPELAVLFLSAHPAEVLAERGWFDRDLPLLRKPFSTDELQDAIASALAAQAWQHA